MSMLQIGGKGNCGKVKEMSDVQRGYKTQKQEVDMIEKFRAA